MSQPSEVPHEPPTTGTTGRDDEPEGQPADDSRSEHEDDSKRIGTDGDALAREEPSRRPDVPRSEGLPIPGGPRPGAWRRVGSQTHLPPNRPLAPPDAGSEPPSPTTQPTPRPDTPPPTDAGSVPGRSAAASRPPIDAGSGTRESTGAEAHAAPVRPRPRPTDAPVPPRRPDPSDTDLSGAEPNRAGPATRPVPSMEPREAPRPVDDVLGPDEPVESLTLRRPWERPSPPAARPGGVTTYDDAPTRPVAPPVPERPSPAPPRYRPEPTREQAARPEAFTHRITRVQPRPGEVVRRRLQRVDARSVFKLALAFYLGVLGVAIVGGSLLWLLLAAAGVISNLESFFGDLLGYEDFRFLFTRILLVMVLVGLVWVVLSAALTALLAAIYNRASRLVGGVEILTDDE